MPSRSSRSRPASRDLLQRADGLGFARSPSPPNSSDSASGYSRLVGKALGLAAGGAPQDARRLGRVLPRAAGSSSVTSRSSRTSCRPSARSAAVSCASQCPSCGARFCLRVRRRVRGVRRRAAPAGAVRREDPQGLASGAPAGDCPCWWPARTWKSSKKCDFLSTGLAWRCGCGKLRGSRRWSGSGNPCSGCSVTRAPPFGTDERALQPPQQHVDVEQATRPPPGSGRVPSYGSRRSGSP